MAIKGRFDAVLDTIGVSETERIGISFLKRGGHYMTLQVGYECHLSHPYHTLQMYLVRWQSDLLDVFLKKQCLCFNLLCLLFH